MPKNTILSLSEEVCKQKRICVYSFRYNRAPFVGTAGCVLAARLSEDPSVKVLLLESGVRYVVSREWMNYHSIIYFSGKSLILTRIPVGFSMLFNTKNVYNLYTEPQSGAKGKKKYWPRGMHQCFYIFACC